MLVICYTQGYILDIQFNVEELTTPTPFLDFP